MCVAFVLLDFLFGILSNTLHFICYVLSDILYPYCFVQLFFKSTKRK